MFNKNKPGDPTGMSIPRAPEPSRGLDLPNSPDSPRAHEPLRQAAARSTNLSTLSAGVRYEGNISGDGDIHVDGALKGDIQVGRVVVGDGGEVEGSIKADLVEIRGRVAGTITGKSVKLYATARVEGDITQEQLAVELGAWFQGRSIQAKREPAIIQGAGPASADKPERYQPEKPAAPALPGAKSTA